MGIQGNLKTVTMANLLQWLTQEPLTGTLVLRRGKTEKRIMLRDGRILFTTSNNPREYLTNYVRHMHLALRDHPEVMEILKEYDESPNLPLGQVLVDRGMITKEDLSRIITTKIKDSIMDLFFWTEGGFEFVEGEIPYDGIVDVTIDSQWVMMEGVRLMDELDRFRIVLSSPHLTFRLTESLKREDARTEEIARMIESGATLGEMCEALYPTDYPTYKLLFEWHEKGRIELGPEKEPPGAREAAPTLAVGDVVLCRHCGMATPSTIPYCEMCGSELVAEERPGSLVRDAYHLLAKGDFFAGRYEIQEIVELGEVGTVYTARDRKHEETVTLTTLPFLPAEAPAVLDNLVAGVRNWRRLRHPNIVRVVDMGKAQGLFYLCLEHIEGARSLGDTVVRKQFSESLERTIQLTTAVLEALDEAHAEGIVHGGLRAQNVLVDRHDHIRVSEFCIANAFSGLSLVERSEILGLPLYAAPEVLEGPCDPDARSDVYSVGVLLYHLVTGELPHVGETPEAIREHRARIAPAMPRQRRPDLPLYLERVILRALSLDPASRPASAGEMLKEIRGGSHRARFRRRARVAGVAAAAAALLLAAVVSVVGWLDRPTPKDVGNLLQQAEAYFASESYIFPAKKNSYDMYRKVLRVDPNNQGALDGIRKIQSLFLERGERAVADGELEAARIWMNKIKLVAPDSERTRALEARFDQAQERLEADAQKAEKVRTLLASASDALTQVELDPARTHKAFEDLNTVSRLDPTNAEAKAAWERLMARLKETAEKQEMSRSYFAARESFALLASLNPGDSTLQAREREIARLADEEAARESRDQAVRDFLDAAERYLSLGQVLTPPGACALESYRHVLQVDPQNEVAMKGLQEIRKSYLIRADAAERGGNLYRAKESLVAAQQAEVDARDDTTRTRIASIDRQLAAQEEKQKRLDTVEGWLAKAKRQLEGGDLTSPKGANALESYREALRLDPGNLVAEAGLSDVQEGLVVQARRGLQSKRFALAKDLLDRAQSVRPGRADLKALAEQAAQALRAQVEEDTRQDKIASLQGAGKRFLQAKQFFVPAGANAFETYSDLLKMDPENQQAKAGLEEIGRVFRSKAEEALAQKNLVEAKVAYEYVLKSAPSDGQAQAKLVEIQELLERRAKVDELLRQADYLYRTRKYTQPAGANALSTYREVLQLAPENREATGRIAAMKAMYLDLARQSEQRSEWPVALDYLKKVVLVDPSDSAQKAHIADLENTVAEETGKLMSMGSLPPAQTAPGAPGTLRPQSAASPGGAGGGTTPVVAEHSQAEATENVEALLARAGDAVNQDKLVGDEGALGLLVRAAGLAPDDARARQELAHVRDLLLAGAKAQRDKGDLVGTVELLKSAALADPGYEPVRQALEGARADLEDRERKLEKARVLTAQATRHLHGNRLEEATKAFRDALATSPGDEDARRGLKDVKQAYVRLAEESIGDGQVEQARDRYAKALSLDPSDSGVQARIKELDQKIARSRTEGKEKEFRPAFSF